MAFLLVACGGSQPAPDYPVSNDPAVEDDFDMADLRDEAADTESPVPMVEAPSESETPE